MRPVRPYLLACGLLVSLASACVTGADDADHVQVQALTADQQGDKNGCYSSSCHGSSRSGAGALDDDAADLTANTCTGCHGSETDTGLADGSSFFDAADDEIDDCPHLELHDALLAGDAGEN